MKRFDQGARGQSFSLEILLVISLTIFMMLTYIGVYKDLEEKGEYRDLVFRGTGIGDNLIENQGYPEDWTAGTVERLGFCQERGKIRESLLREFTLISSNQTLAGATNAGKYNVLIEVKYVSNGMVVTVDGKQASKGKPVNASATDVFKLRDYAVYNNTRVVVEVTVWS